MERRKHLGLLCLCLAILLLLIIAPVPAFTHFGTYLLSHLTPTPLPPSPTAIPSTPTTIPPTPTPRPTPTPLPILTVRGTPPPVAASEFYMIDMDTQHVLANGNSVKTQPMASTTKIMTAFIAITSGNLAQPVTVHQDSLDRVAEDSSSANLRLGDTLSLQDMLYAMMLPSGNDAAIAIADALAGNTQNFVQRMNLFAYRLHLFQTHYANPDGLSLTPEEDLQHYTSAYDLTRLAEDALRLPLFAKIVHTDHYTLPATSTHAAYSWTTTDTLLDTYPGMLGVKTGFTYAAGYCLVFAAKRNGHELLGVVLHSSSEEQRNLDATTLLNWGFSLPLLSPT